MRDIVILAVSGRLGLRTLAQLCFTIEGVVFAFVSKAVLCQVLVHSDLDLVFLIGIKPKERRAISKLIAKVNTYMNSILRSA